MGFFFICLFVKSCNKSLSRVFSKLHCVFEIRSKFVSRVTMSTSFFFRIYKFASPWIWLSLFFSYFQLASKLMSTYIAIQLFVDMTISAKYIYSFSVCLVSQFRFFLKLHCVFSNKMFLVFKSYPVYKFFLRSKNSLSPRFWLDLFCCMCNLGMELEARNNKRTSRF